MNAPAGFTFDTGLSDGASPGGPGDATHHVGARRGPLARFADILRGEGPDLTHSRALLPRAIALAELPPPRTSRLLIWLVSTTVIIFAVWASLVPIDEVASAPGEILPQLQVQPVQHLEGGIVAEINAADGQAVRKGDPIITLDGAAVLADLERAKARRTALALQAERLLAFSTGRAARFTTDPTGQLAGGEAVILSAQRQSREAQLAVAASQSAEKRHEVEALRGREEGLRRQVELLKREMAARKPLVDRGLISSLSYLAQERELSRLEGNLAETTGDRRQAETAVVEAQRSGHEIDQRLRADALNDYGSVAGQLTQADQEVKRLESQAQRLVVRAPMDGTVKGLTAISVRQVIPPGGVVAEVVPQTGPIVAMVRMSPAEIGHVRVGSDAIVKVATYDFTRNGGVHGTVDYVSASSFVDEEGHSYFKVRLALASDHVGARQQNYVLKPGMTVVADVKTGSKTLTQYLFKPVSRALDNSFREP